MRKSLICLVLAIFLFSVVQAPAGLSEVAKSPTKIDPEAPATMTVANNKLQVSKWAGFSTVSVEMPSIKGFTDYEYRVYDTSLGKEVDLILHKIPLTNVFYYPIMTKNAEFYYQPELTADEIAQGYYRPPEVVGSYAVYGPYKNNEYGTGKIMHIYRPKVVAADGSWIWGVLDYKDGVLSVTVDLKWLTNAKYPVTIDPEFGYHTVGGSIAAVTVNSALGSAYATSAYSGTAYVSTISVYCWDDAGNDHQKPGMWVNSDGGAVIQIAPPITTPSVAGWETSTFATPQLIAPSTTYMLGVVADGTCYVYYDSAGGTSHTDSSNTYATPGVFDWTANDVYRYSIYCTYSTAPTITSSTITDLDDTTNVYAMKKYYSFVTEITDVEGATDIKAISVRGMQGATVRWLVNATSLDGVPAYAIVSGDSVIDLDAASCSFSEAGNVGTLTLKIRAEWDATNEADCDIGVWARDVSGASVGWTTVQTDYYSTITRLVTYNFASNVTSATINQRLMLSGYVRYATTIAGDTPSSSYPPDAQFTAVKVYDDDSVLKGTNNTVTDGFFSVIFDSSDVLRTTAYRAWLDMAPDYTDGYAPDGDIVYVTTGSSYYQAPLIDQAFAYYGLAVANILAVLSAFVVYFASSATAMISLIGSIMTAIIFVSGSLIYWLSLFVNFFVGLFTVIGDVIDGTSSISTGLGDMWAYFGFATWATAVPVFAFVFWVSSVSSRTAKSGRSNVEIIVGDLQIVTYLVGTVWEWTYTVFNFVVNIIMQFLSVIVP